MSRQDANAAFARTSFLYGGNAGYIEDLYARYEADPSAVDQEWRNFFGSRGGRLGRCAVVWRRGVPRSIRWNPRNMPAMRPDRKKNAPTATRKSGHTSPDRRALVRQLVHDGDIDRHVGLTGLHRRAAAAAATTIAAAW